MVRSFVIAAAALAWTGSGQAQAADWRRAGGDLFVSAAAATPEVRSSNQPADDAPRIPALTQPDAEAVAAAAERYGLDPKLLHAMVIVESAYRADAVSRVGASGLTQLMPRTAATLGVAEKTIKNYVSNVLAKLGVDRRTEVVVLAATQRERAAHDRRAPNGNAIRY